MAGSAHWRDYQRVMAASADCLNRLGALGYTWNNTHGVEGIETAGRPSCDSRNCQPEPIILSSSSSGDSEDDVPLSLRIKRAKVNLTDDVSSGIDRTQLQSKSTAPERPAEMGKAPTESESAAEKDQQAADDLHKGFPDAAFKGKAVLQASAGGDSRAQGIPPHKPGMPQSSTSVEGSDAPKGTSKHHRARQKPKLAKKRAKLETVIDLDPNPSDHQFTTIPPSPPMKKGSLKKLWKSNPTLAKAVEERMHSHRGNANLQPPNVAQPFEPLQKITKVQRAQARRQAKQKSGDHSDRLKPNWEAAGQSFWSSLGVSNTAEKGSKARAPPEHRFKKARLSSQNGYSGPAVPAEEAKVASASNPGLLHPQGTPAGAGHPQRSNPRAHVTRTGPVQGVEQNPEASNSQARESALNHRQDAKNTAPAFGKLPEPTEDEEGDVSSGERGLQPETSESSEPLGGHTDLEESVQELHSGIGDNRAEVEDEEWRARRIEIEKQAFEARQLKKKKRAEADLRLRAEERVNEYRLAEAAKVDAIKEKESLRATYRDGLRLRLKGKKTLRDILVALGCQVESNQPASVTKAYRKALLHFHPDRHVNSPVPAQIYAEEAFKIISEAAKS